MTYYALMAKEFPEFNQQSLPENIPDDWEDISWHNDACPSFAVPDSELVVFIDFANPAEREFPGIESRFIVVDRKDNPDGNPDLLQTSDWLAVLECVIEHTCPMKDQGHRDTGRGVCAHCGKVLA